MGLTPATLAVDATEKRAQAVTISCRIDSCQRLRRTSQARPSLRRRRARPRRLDAVPARACVDALRARAARRDRHLRRARGARRAPDARSAPPARSARATASASSSRATASSRRTASALRVARRRYKRRLLALERCQLSEDLRHELAAIAPRATATGSRSCRGSSTRPGSVHLRGRGEVAVHLDLVEPGGRAARVQPPARVRRRRPRSAPTAGARSTGATRYQLHVAGDDARAARCCTRPASSTPRIAPLERPPRRVVARACCRARVPARRAARRRLAQRPARAAPRDPHAPASTGAEFLAEWRRREGCRLGVARPRPSRGRVREGRRGDRGRARRSPARATPCSRFEERAVVGATRARANRLANADHANLVRTSRAAHEQLRAVAGASRDGRLDRAAAPLREVARAAAPPPVALAPRARAQVPAADDEGRRSHGGCGQLQRAALAD